MADSYLKLLKGNAEWVAEKNISTPEFFEQLSKSQNPTYLWIGCADSRVPANQITGTQPGEIFVHRNIANLVVHTDINMLSVLQYAVEVLKVNHVIVCGHYGCGGVKAALSNTSFGLIDNWLRNIKDVYRLHEDELDHLQGEELENKMVELSVKEQVLNLCKTTIVQDAWRTGEELMVHGWVYSLEDGRLRDLQVSAHSNEDIDKIFQFDMRIT
jgi:carbonic anhydrase